MVDDPIEVVHEEECEFCKEMVEEEMVPKRLYDDVLTSLKNLEK